MYASIKASLIHWNDTTTDREKLQHAYIATAIVLLVVAGIAGLLNQPLGQKILTGAIATAGILLVNAVAWALLQSFVLLRVTPKEKPAQPSKKSSRKK